MKRLLYFLAFVLSTTASAQQYDVSGTLADTSGKPIANAAVSLLDPADSTLAFFGVSNTMGQFKVASVKGGNYLMQIASMGYRVYYKSVHVPGPAGNNLGYFILREVSEALQGVEVKSQRIPMMLKGDTIEYNAGAFKVKQDAVVEDLLRKMPGIQLDKSGNVKAQGKDVKKVLVDGKEFFGNDPKMATKNLPADAIDKVQVFGNRSDQSQFTGIDDGERDQTINLQLKDGKRKGYFGDVEAGGGTDDHYKLSTHLYRFQPKQQFALLGMLNNINQFGFTFQDYLTFQGGMQSLMNGDGQINIRAGSNMPVNFGQPVTGLIGSGAAGINYSSNGRPGNRFTISYLGNGAEKELSQQSTSHNFITTGRYTTAEDLRQQNSDYAHRLNLSWRNDLDSSQQILLRGGATITNNRSARNLSSVSDMNDSIRNQLSSFVEEDGTGIDATLSASYIKKFRGSKWPVWKVYGTGSLESGLSRTEWNNSSLYLHDTIPNTDHQYQDNDKQYTNWESGTSLVRKIGNGSYLEPAVKAGNDVDAFVRRQGLLPTGNETDSLSPDFECDYKWVRGGISLRHNTTKVQLSVTLDGESGQLGSKLASGAEHAARYQYLKPSAFYQNTYRQGAMVSASYSTSISPPDATQMLPVTNYLNPLQRITGNALLAPEYRHTLQGSWNRFDQFSFTSVMVHMRATYTNNKVSWSRHVTTDLSEDLTYVNVPDDYVVNASIEYNTPVPHTGTKLTASFEERYNNGESLVNDATNRNTTFNHNVRLSLGTQKKNKWDLEGGVETDITQAHSTLDGAGSSQFYHYNGFAQVTWRPSSSFNCSVNATVDKYVAPSFPDAVTVPLLNASASYYFLKYKRGVVTLDAFDLLNRNTSLQRISQLNYLLERRTNIIQQYFLLSFKYRLSKAGNGKSGVDIQVRH